MWRSALARTFRVAGYSLIVTVELTVRGAHCVVGVLSPLGIPAEVVRHDDEAEGDEGDYPDLCSLIECELGYQI